MMKTPAALVLILTAVFTLSCDRKSVIKGQLAPRTHYDIQIHPHGDNSVLVRILSPHPVPETAAWAEILVQSLKIASGYALHIDDLVIEMPRSPYGGERYTISMSNYQAFVQAEVPLESLLDHIRSGPLHPRPKSFFQSIK